jgi:hypothetical protein
MRHACQCSQSIQPFGLQQHVHNFLLHQSLTLPISLISRVVPRILTSMSASHDQILHGRTDIPACIPAFSARHFPSFPNTQHGPLVFAHCTATQRKHGIQHVFVYNRRFAPVKVVWHQSMYYDVAEGSRVLRHHDDTITTMIGQYVEARGVTGTLSIKSKTHWNEEAGRDGRE